MIEESSRLLYKDTYTLENLDAFASAIASFTADYKIWLFEGEMGAGKTTLIKALGKALNVTDNITSPTFSLVNEYCTKTGETIHHFDFYRLKEEEEALNIGAEEYFYSGNLCLIEWPSRIPSLIPEKHLKIFINLGAENQRIAELFVNED